jgi:DnaJ-class molecular chaperone
MKNRKQLNIFEMSFDELKQHEEKERRRKNLCDECRGSGKIAEAGIFSKYYKCEKCNGSGKNK